MRLYAGCSGFSYKEWIGSFYPEGIKSAQMLGYYASKLDTVEINNTFYRMPRARVLASWAEQVPAHFRFVLKASRRITHHARLKETAEPVEYLWSVAQHLGTRLGPVLFQLPPNLERDDVRLLRFLDAVPDGMRVVMEFRHASWFDDEIVQLLRHHGAALCASDMDGDGPPEPLLVHTAPFGYLRLRKESYSRAELADWMQRITTQGWDEAYVFFKHEDEGAAAKLALELMEVAGESGT